MAEKAAARGALAELGWRLGCLPPTAEMPNAAQTAQREVLLAEAAQWVADILPDDSPVLVLFRKALESTTNDGSNSPPSQVATAIEAVEAAKRWNEARMDMEATSGLADDVERILSRNFLNKGIVRAALAILGLAAAFAVYGDIRFRDMRISVLEDIEHKRDEVKVQVDALQAKVAATSTSAAALDQEVAGARKRLGDVVAAAARDLAAEKGAAIESAAASAVLAVDAARSQAVGRVGSAVDVPGLQAARSEALSAIGRAASVTDVASAKADAIARLQAAANTGPIDAEVTLAQARIKAAATQAVEEAKGRVAPTFDTAIKNDAHRLDDMGRAMDGLADQLKESRSELSAVEASLRRVGSEDKLAYRLAAYFDETVVAVYVVLGACLLLFIVHLTMFLRRRQG